MENEKEHYYEKEKWNNQLEMLLQKAESASLQMFMLLVLKDS